MVLKGGWLIWRHLKIECEVEDLSNAARLIECVLLDADQVQVVLLHRRQISDAFAYANDLSALPFRRKPS